MSSSGVQRTFQRRISSNFHRRFPNVDSFVAELGGSRALAIEKILIANNGVGAVKAIRSIRKWAYDVFGDERAISFVVMATPEDLRSNAEYIRMADTVVDVPGGSNNHNYANVTLIVELARLHGVQAVWAGWGHASENPVLPDTLGKSNPPIKFIGPSGPPMRALGDKIGSTIIAQSAGVPCIGWNGDGVFAAYSKDVGSLPDEAYKAATVKNVSEAASAAERIGFPVMIKASEGGGGKGIRKVMASAGVADAFRQVSGEVPGSPIFIMKLSDKSRHLEVQLLADEYGDAVALNGRDCSVQRRHQKIIEEGPPVAAPKGVWAEMEKAAVNLAKAVGYANAGTVEYLYSEEDEKFYFLELNPRLQVEHPVTEMITGVNLPAAQLQVAMGIPLHLIPDIRELYGKNRFEDTNLNTTIDFEVEQRIPPQSHCIAVRITAENAEAGFKPTSGGIQELNFRSTPSVWGYFSMDSSGSIHEFADSQFGHLFASGSDREQARRNMVLALKELSIRGDISTTVDYISKLIELDDFIFNRIDTGWLDALIQKNAEDGRLNKSSSSNEESLPSLEELGIVSAKKKKILSNHTYVVIGATVVAFNRSSLGEKQFVEALQKGHLPSRTLLAMEHQVELILEGVKYKLWCCRTGENTFVISVSSSEDGNTSTAHVETNVRVLSDGGYLIALGDKSHVAYMTSRGEEAAGMKFNIGGATICFSPDYDPASLRTDVAGKLVKKLIEDGARAEKGDSYAEIEVMKMFMPLKVEETGKLSWHMNEGAALAPGDLLASLELENPDNVAQATVFEGDLEVEGWGAAVRNPDGDEPSTRPHVLLRQTVDRLEAGVAGYLLNSFELEQCLADLQRAALDPLLPVYEVEAQLSVISGRIDMDLSSDLIQMVNDFKQSSEAGRASRFPAEKLLEKIVAYAATLENSSDHAAFVAVTTPLRDAISPYAKNPSSDCAGSERALSCILSLFRSWTSNERWFCDGPSYADSVDTLRKVNKENFDTVLRVCRAHAQVLSTSEVVSRLIDLIGEGGKSGRGIFGKEFFLAAQPCLSDIRNLGGNEAYASVALKARRVLLQETLPSITERKSRAEDVVSKIVDTGAESKVIPGELASFVTENVALADIFFPVLGSLPSGKEANALLEMYARHILRTNVVKEVSSSPLGEGLLKVAFSNKQSESVLSSSTSVTSMTDLTRLIRSNSIDTLEDAEKDEESNLIQSRDRRPIATMQRTGVFKIVESMEEITGSTGNDVFKNICEAFPQFVGEAPSCQFGPINVLHIFIRNKTVTPGDEMEDTAASCEQSLQSVRDLLKQADVRRVSFIVGQNKNSDGNDDVEDYPMPAIFTYRAMNDFREDVLFRHIEPGLAYHLELTRLSKNFDLRSLDSRHMTTGHVHLYEATPKAKALERDIKASKSPRVFVRSLSFVSEFTSASFERTLVDAMNALDLSAHNVSTSSGLGDNHLFVNIVSDYDKVFDPALIEQVVSSLLKRHDERITRLRLAEVETRIVCRLTEDSPPIAIRMVASNPTGYVHVMNTYVEAADDTGTRRVYRLIGGTKTSLASSGDSSWEGMDVDAPYPLTRPFDAQRKAAAKASDSLYCYDLPALFEAAVEKQWNDVALSVGGDFASCRPLMVMYTTELVVQKKDSLDLEPWTMEDYLNGELELEQMQRGAGANDVGMVAWLMVLKTVEYPEGRQLVIIANDITYKAGSFGTKEDVVFKLASEFAREKRIPRLFIAANSGARIGTAEAVKRNFKVAFKNEEKPENGFDYLYVSPEDYEKLKASDVIAEPAVGPNGEDVYKLTDIIGSEPDLGVENLKGSGLIAGETSVAYDDIFTMTLVLGRTVGIGAYLVRLGQRTIQKTRASPIILTGYQALNKLMGCEVYSTNDQLGGPGIMYSNGVSHQVADDHLSVIQLAIEWLSYVPSIRGGLLPISDIRSMDTIDREIEFVPSPGVPYDPRHLLTGLEGNAGVWQSGFFDQGSFTETLAGWAKTVVVGRARLGGIPMGVIITENRTTEAVKPADPADLKASEAVIQEAGCVWFPNSAYKTAQAINDFRTEDLPLIVFANWRGFSGGQRDMFDEVLKYGSLIVDAFVAYEQPVFVFIPPFAEIRGGAWVVLDASINSSVMEMYASANTARGGVLEANGAASVKYRTKDLLVTMHRLDDKLKTLTASLTGAALESERSEIRAAIAKREQALLPVYEQISVQFCDLHDTPGRMKAVGVIEQVIEWKQARRFFFWRLRRKLAEFDLRKKVQQAAEVGRGIKSIKPLEASDIVRQWFLDMSGATPDSWNDDRAVLAWMAQSFDELEGRVRQLTRDCVSQEVLHVMTAGGKTAEIGTSGLVDGMKAAYDKMSKSDKENFKMMMKAKFDI